MNVDRLLQELSSLRAENAQLRATSELAFRDSLTGLRNRRYLAQRLEEELGRARRGGACGSVLLLDVNDFKQVNDTHGHNAGDQVLCFVAELLEATMRSSDVCCRTGGDEFVVLLADTDERGAQVARRRLLEVLEEENRTRLLKVRLSVGSASWPTHGEGAEEVLHAADVAMYQHKRASKLAAAQALTCQTA
jgi:diguanylate cyclase (GGDEF)-like protein